VKIIGTVQYQDGKQQRISADGGTYDEAMVALRSLLQEDQQLIVIRTDNY
jgi:hypothetical protein